MHGDWWRCLQEGFTVALTSLGHPHLTPSPKQVPSWIISWSHILGEEKKSRCNRFSSKRYLQGGWCPALTATATGHGESPISLSFATCAAWIPIFHLAGECHNHQATGYSGLRNGGHLDCLSWKLFFTGVTEILINRRRKRAKETVTHT